MFNPDLKGLSIKDEEIFDKLLNIQRYNKPARCLNMTKRNEYVPQTVTHPGVTLKEKLDELGMSQKEFAVRTGKLEQTIAEVIDGQSALTPDMAVKFESVLAIPARFWLNRQLQYDEAVAGLSRQ